MIEGSWTYLVPEFLSDIVTVKATVLERLFMKLKRKLGNDGLNRRLIHTETQSYLIDHSWLHCGCSRLLSCYLTPKFTAKKYSKN